MSGREVWVTGIGAVTPAGTGVDALVAALVERDWQPTLGLDHPDGLDLPVAACRDFTGREHLPPLVARRLDRSARLLAVAADEALRPQRPALSDLRDRTGVAVATWTAGTSPLVDVLTAVFLTGPEEASPMLFPSTVANAPAGQLGILEKLGGPNLTVHGKQIGGLQALAEARRMVATGRCDVALAGAVDEAHWLNAEGFDRIRALARTGGRGMRLAEGASIMMLAPEPTSAPLARLAGAASWSSPAPPHRYPDSAGALTHACRIAIARAGLAASDIDLVVSARNGVAALDALEHEALSEIFGTSRPMLVAPAERLGDGAFTSALRVATAILAVNGRVVRGWPAAASGPASYPELAGRSRAALVPALAGGGGTAAVVVTAP